MRGTEILITGGSAELLAFQTEDGAKLPRRRSTSGYGESPSPAARVMEALARSALTTLLPVGRLGLEIALETMADASKLALAANLNVGRPGVRPSIAFPSQPSPKIWSDTYGP